MAFIAARVTLLGGLLLVACSTGQDIDSDTRPVVTTVPITVTATDGSSSTGGESSTTSGGSSSDTGTTEAVTTEPETTSTKMTEDMCEPGAAFCTCKAGACDDGLSCIGALCQPYLCGNGVVEVLEACDDGNDIKTDDCLPDCTMATCGDGFVHEGVEACDLGAVNSNEGACKLNCAAQVCGDGFVGPGEACDDGNVEYMVRISPCCSNSLFYVS